MRYDKGRKIDRNKAVREYQEKHPEASLEEIGQVFGGLSRQRIHQIIKKQDGKNGTANTL